METSAYCQNGAATKDRNEVVGSDLDLLRLIGDGDQQAYNTLFRRFYPRLCQFCSRLLRQHDLIEEVVSDTLFVVWRSAERFKGQSKVSTWIFGIAYRQSMKALDKQRRRGMQTAQDNFLENLPAEPATSDPQLRSLDQRRWRQAREAINQLNPDAQAALYLVAAGHNYADIAKITGCPENTVKTRMFNARRQLRERLLSQDVPSPTNSIPS